MADSIEETVRKIQEEKRKQKQPMQFDQDLYGDQDDEGNYASTVQDDSDYPARRGASWSAPKEIIDEIPMGQDSEDYNPMPGKKTIADRESDYHARRRNRKLSPDRVDVFSKDRTLSEEARSYVEVMRETQLDREREDVIRKIQAKQREEEELKLEEQADALQPKRKRRWDDTTGATTGKSQWDRTEDETPVTRGRWDETPRIDAGGDEKPVAKKRNRWDETPLVASAGGETPRVSSWDQTPLVTSGLGAEGSQTGRRGRSRWGETPVLGKEQSFGATPSTFVGSETGGKSTVGSMTPEQLIQMKFDREMEQRNRPLSDEDLEQLLPSVGYKVLVPPESYRPIRTPARKLTATPAPMSGQGEGFFIQEEDRTQTFDVVPEFSGPMGETLPLFKPEDVQFFGKLLDNKGEDDMTLEEAKERKIMRLLLRIKNGTPVMRKASLKQITEKAREFGAGPLFNHILPLLMSPSLEDQERHLLVKVIDRILFKLDDLVRPYTHKILVVIEPMLIDEDYYARVEGREIISNLSKAAGLATMISTMRPDIDHVDEYVRNTTARAFSVVASALGVPALLPFLKAVCRSKKSWQARHTGIKIVQQIAMLLGCGILPHLRGLVETIAHGLEDEQHKVRTMAALAVAALAEAAYPYGIESFESVLNPLWEGTRKHRGKGLAAFLKAIGFIIPLMDQESANEGTRGIMRILIREFQTPDEEMKKIVLKVVKQCALTDGVAPQYIREEILPDYFKYFWVRRMALDRRNYKQLVETTLELANKVGVGEILGRLIPFLKDESEPFRKMASESIDQIVTQHGAADIDERMEKLLIDGLLFAFQEQLSEELTLLNSFGTVVNALGLRTKQYLPQICSTILWRLNNKSAKIRQQAADLIARVALVMNTCGEEKLLGHLGVVLYEYLGEEFPDVLGSILSGLKAIVNVVGMTRMNPPIKDLLPRLTPILKNRHEKVQENCIDLIGRIADRGAEFVSAREWMRICFELLETLKAQKKAIRRAAVNTFGYIAKAVGPSDVLATLLNNLKVQERQLRVCTTVAIAIVAETCSPFTVLPALMNEYRVPEMNVQNGVLKSLSFMFEYIGEMGKDYVYAIAPLLEDALMDRDAVHRQTAAAAVKHLALGCIGFGVEDALLHLLNYVWPNVLETSPHVINNVLEAIEALRIALGPTAILQYCMQGLFHPARKVREAYWRVYNNLYIGSQEALVPSFPHFPNENRNGYRRDELFYLL